MNHNLLNVNHHQVNRWLYWINNSEWLKLTDCKLRDAGFNDFYFWIIESNLMIHFWSLNIISLDGSNPSVEDLRSITWKVGSNGPGYGMAITLGAACAMLENITTMCQTSKKHWDVCQYDPVCDLEKMYQIASSNHFNHLPQQDFFLCPTAELWSDLEHQIQGARRTDRVHTSTWNKPNKNHQNRWVNYQQTIYVPFSSIFQTGWPAALSKSHIDGFRSTSWWRLSAQNALHVRQKFSRRPLTVLASIDGDSLQWGAGLECLWFSGWCICDICKWHLHVNIPPKCWLIVTLFSQKKKIAHPHAPSWPQSCHSHWKSAWGYPPPSLPSCQGPSTTRQWAPSD